MHGSIIMPSNILRAEAERYDHHKLCDMAECKGMPCHSCAVTNEDNLSLWLVEQNNKEVPEETKSEAVTAINFLEAAKGHMEDRATTYDSPEGERSMGKAITAFNSVTGNTLKESDGWLLLQLLKDTRQWSREHYHEDSAEDCIAFAALKAESLARGD